MHQLSIPPDAHMTDQAVEVFRGWVIDGGLQCSLRASIWGKTPEVWGILLADAARHIANGIAAETGVPSSDVFAAIKARLESELNSPSANHEGEFLK